jgi:glycosyltransferase involved in cell wall biosynthesis
MPALLAMTKGMHDPASRFRLVQWIPHLERAGWDVKHFPCRPDHIWSSSLSGRWARALHHRAGKAVRWVNRLRDINACGKADAVFVNRNLAGRGISLERRLLTRNPRVLFDFDDAIFVGPGERVAELMCRNAAWVTPGNDYLAEYARRFTDRVTVVPTVIDTERYPAPPYHDRPVIRVGWSGSDQSLPATLFPFLGMLRDLQKSVKFELVVLTNTRPILPVAGLDWTFHPWSAEDESRLGEKFDVGLMPLVDDDFQRGKCGLKLLQYMAAGLPTIASPVGVNRQITEPGVTGYLASTGTEWAQAIRSLIANPRLRMAMGAAGRQRCRSHYSVERWLPVMLHLLGKVASLPVRAIA